MQTKQSKENELVNELTKKRVNKKRTNEETTERKNKTRIIVLLKTYSLFLINIHIIHFFQSLLQLKL